MRDMAKIACGLFYGTEVFPYFIGDTEENYKTPSTDIRFPDRVSMPRPHEYKAEVLTV
jgi:hypothetical protein